MCCASRAKSSRFRSMDGPFASMSSRSRSTNGATASQTLITRPRSSSRIATAGHQGVGGMPATAPPPSTTVPASASTSIPSNARPAPTGSRSAPRRWTIERSIDWLKHHRRLARDYETHPHHSEAMIHIAMSDLMTRRLTGENTPNWRGTKHEPQGKTLSNGVCANERLSLSRWAASRRGGGRWAACCLAWVAGVSGPGLGRAVRLLSGGAGRVG